MAPRENQEACFARASLALSDRGCLFPRLITIAAHAPHTLSKATHAQSVAPQYRQQSVIGGGHYVLVVRSAVGSM